MNRYDMDKMVNTAAKLSPQTQNGMIIMLLARILEELQSNK